MGVTVLVPAATTALTTLEHVCLDMGFEIGGPRDKQIGRFIDQASSTAAEFCRRTFGRETVRERFEIDFERIDDVTGGLLLDRSPVASVVSVTVDGVLLAASSYETDGRFLYRAEAGQRRCWYGRAVVVDYVAGWFLPSELGETPAGVERLPPSLERAVIQLVGASISAANRDPMVKSESVEGVGTQSFYVSGSRDELPHLEAQRTLERYRRPFCA